MKKFKGIFGRGKHQTEGATASVPKNGYDVREKDLPKIHKAAWAGDAQKVKQLAKKDVNQIDKENRTALHLASVLGHKDVVQALLEWKAKTNICDAQGKSPLMKAVECGQEECVRLLLEYSSDMQLTDTEKNTPLHAAVREGNQSIAKLLVEDNAKLNAKNCFGYTPLILSVLDTNKRDDLARLLLSNGADPNVTDNNTRTALHHACSEDCINHVKLLLQHKANTSMKDAKGWTAEDCAMMKGNHGCAQLLFDHNLKLRKQFTNSLPNTPRNTESLPVSSASTPRPSDASGYGIPQAALDGHDDSDEQTVSKVSSPGDGRQDSWADDTDISSAMDDHKKKPQNAVPLNNEDLDESDLDTDMEDEGGAPKISLTKNVRLDDSDAEGDTNQKLKSGPKTSGSFGDIVRPVYSRTPTPTSPVSNQAAASKIPVRNVSDDYSYEEEPDVDDSSPQQKNKVSFKKEQDVRNISATDDDTDVDDPEDEEEDVEPTKKRRIETPEEAADSDMGYIPSMGGSMTSKMSPEKFKDHKAMLQEVGIDDVSDVSDAEELSEQVNTPVTSQTNTPRGILKPSKSTGKPPSVHQPIESDQYWDSEEEENVDQNSKLIVEAEVHLSGSTSHAEDLDTLRVKDDESEWDSTRHSDTPRSRGPETPREDSIRVESPNTEYDSDIEGTLNPENSAKDKKKSLPTGRMMKKVRLNLTSQWDSSEENYTPRTPRNLDMLQDTSPNVISYDESEVVEDVEDAVTSFITKKVAAHVEPTPEPKSDSSQPRSRESPDVHTTSNSASGQKTVIPATHEEVEDEEEEEDKDSDWDSDADERFDGDEGNEDVAEIRSYVSPHQTPRGHTSSNMTDDESAGEWEIERQKEKEAKEKRLLEERQQAEENLRRLMAEQDEARRLIEEEERREIEEEERRQMEEEERRQIEEEERRQAEEDERLMKEAERLKLAELEAEEERQSQWEAEQSRRTAELEKEALEELQRERQADFDSSEGDFSDFSDNDDHVLADDNQPIIVAEMSEHSQHASQGSEDLVRSQGSEHSHTTSFDGSQKIGRELKKPPPKLVVRQFFTPSNEARNPFKMGEIENESPVPVQPVQTGALYSSPPPPPAENQLQVLQDSEDEIDEIDDQVEVAVAQVTRQEVVSSIPERPLVEERVSAIQSSLVSTSAAQFKTSVEPPTTNGYQPSHVPVASLLPSNTPPPLPTSAPPGGKAMSLHSDGNSADEDDYDQQYVDRKTPKKKGPGRTSFNLPDFSGNTGLYSAGLDPFEDDGLSVTSTENGDISSSYRPDNLPYGKDMLVNMNLNDSNAVLKLQEHLREHRGQLEQERNQKMLLENKQKMVIKEKAELEKTIGSLKYQKSALEQNALDLEAKIRTLEYSVAEEEEKRKNAEMLLNKTKEHLTKKEEQFTQEMEAKQRAELHMRNLQMEVRTAQSQIKELEEEKEELDRLLANEKNARQLQEKINEEQQRLQQHIHEESLKFSSQRDEDGDESQSALELADGDIKTARDLVEKYRNEVVALKSELQRQRSRLTEENSMLSSENEKLTQRIEDLKNEVRLNEDALTQLTVQQNLHQSKLVSESTMLNNNLEKEQVARGKLEAELESVKSRLHVTTIQLEKAQQARSDFERRLHSDREDWARQLERKEQELNKLFEKIQTDLHQSNATETRLNAVENELSISNTSLLERTNQYQQAQRELQHYKGLNDNHDSTVRTEKDRCSKLQIKIDSLNERLSAMQHENLSLRQQLDTAHNTATERSGLDLQQKLDHMISNLKADHDKARNSLEEKNNNLQDTISHLREEVRNAENRRSNQEQDLRRLNQEQNDLIRKLSIAEASLDVAAKARDNLEQERLALKMEVEKMQQKYHSSQEKTIEAQTRMNELIGRLDQTEQSRLLSNQQLADTSASMQAYNSSKVELEESYQKLQVDNVRIEAELKHEKQKSELLQRDLTDTQKVRSSLEALCSNLKSTNAHLEEKLGPGQLREVTTSTEAACRASCVKDAEEHKGLWEQEVLSRSKLGLRIAQLDRQKQETAAQLEEEKRKTRKALEQKRLAESKLESEQDKVGTLQKEVVNLKTYLKVAKKKLKATDTNQTRFSTLHSAFDHERNAMEEMLVSVKSQLEHMKLQLEEEQEDKARISQKNVQLENELKTIKKLERSVQKIDRSKRKLEQEFMTYKNNVETGYTDKATVEETKKEIETRYRMELNRKLDEVNNYLEEQARTRHRLDSSRDEHEEKIRHEKKKLEEDMTDVRIKYEQAAAQKETAQQEVRRYRDLYESEMQWRMRLSEQLSRSTDKAHHYKSSVLAERQKSRLYGSLTNLSMNGHGLDLSRINGSLADDALSNKLRAELDRSIAKHLEAAPHDQMRPFIRTEDPTLSSSNFAKANADYMEVLKRKFCV